jgi:Domain of unknown function (DUF397)
MDGYRTACANSTCVEVLISDVVRVRDTAGNVCTYTRDEWRAFVEGVKASEFDLEET